jgi:hypothetical protein
MAGSDDSQSPVGYKQPPLHTQFKPGRSGNTKGRPRGSKNFSTVIEQELRARIEVHRERPAQENYKARSHRQTDCEQGSRGRCQGNFNPAE